MIITEKAVSKVKEMATQQGLDGYGLRLMVVGGGCSGFTYDMELVDHENNEELIIDRDGIKVYVDPMSYQFLDGTIIDYIESFKFSGFAFENPNATRTCGCGSSFSV
tara:strand:+ start:73 stop:393 length:321 start_codon:yes stop_codon:yes gene_type:complete